MATIKEAIEYSKVNPNSAFATELRKRIESGQMNTELEQAGLNQYVTAPVKSGLLETAKGVAKGVIDTTLDTPRLAESAGKMILGGVSKGIEKVTGNQVPQSMQIQEESALAPVDKALEPSNPDQATGKTVGTIATVLSPLGLAAGTKAVKVGKLGLDTLKSTLESALPKNPKIAQKAVDFISADPDKKVATILQRTSPEEISNFAKLAEKASTDGEAPTPFEITGEKLANTTKVLQEKLNQIGKAKSDIIQPMREGLESFKKETTPLIEKLNSLKNSFTEVDKGNSAIVDAVIKDAKTVSTKMDADKFVDKLQDAIYTGNTNQTIARGSALDKQLRGIIGEYNSSLKKSLPDAYGELNNQYSKLIDNLDVINRSLGEVVDGVPVRGASLIKQYFSPSGSKAKEIFEFIKKETNGEVDLAKDATLSKFTMELFDDPRARSLLQGIGDIPTTIPGIVKKVAEKVGGDKLQKALRKSTLGKAARQSQKPPGQ